MSEWQILQGSEHIYANRGKQHLVDAEIAAYLNNLEAECARYKAALEEKQHTVDLLAAELVALEPTAEKASEEETPNL